MEILGIPKTEQGIIDDIIVTACLKKIASSFAENKKAATQDNPGHPGKPPSKV